MTAAVVQPLAKPMAWTPDPMLAAAARAGGVRLLDLEPVDRCWLVASLTVEGLTAEEIAARTGCRLRKIRYVRADPLTTMMTNWLVAQAQADAAAQRADALDRWCTTTIARCEQTSSKTREQLASAVDQIRELRARCREHQHRVAVYQKYLSATRSRRPAAPAPVDQLALF